MRTIEVVLEIATETDVMARRHSTQLIVEDLNYHLGDLHDDGKLQYRVTICKATESFTVGTLAKGDTR